ncbi:hypothetical protein VTK56DRAFT_1415 [Thermocarpiscus australiensis]
MCWLELGTDPEIIFFHSDTTPVKYAQVCAQVLTCTRSPRDSAPSRWTGCPLPLLSHVFLGSLFGLYMSGQLPLSPHPEACAPQSSHHPAIREEFLDMCFLADPDSVNKPKHVRTQPSPEGPSQGTHNYSSFHTALQQSGAYQCLPSPCTPLHTESDHDPGSSTWNLLHQCSLTKEPIRIAGNIQR